MAMAGTRYHGGRRFAALMSAKAPQKNRSTECPCRKCYPARTPLKSASLQEDETEASLAWRSECNNVTLRLETARWSSCERVSGKITIRQRQAYVKRKQIPLMQGATIWRTQP